MRRTAVLLLHLGHWLTYLLLLAVVFAVANIQRGRPPSLSHVLPLYPLVLLCVVPNLFAFYTSYFVLFGKFLSRRRLLALAVAGALVCAGAAQSGTLISAAVFGLDQPIFADPREFFGLTAVLFSLAAIHGAVALVMRGFINWYDELRLKEELARKSHELELALVKSHLNPHFLFNTINNIDVLIARDPAEASRYLNKLSGILRYLLYEAKAERIALAEELRYVGEYLELQRIRTANRGYVDYEVAGEPGGHSIAPMLLFPFIENAFKHTEHDRRRNSIDIRVAVAGGELRFSCRNTHRHRPDSKRDFGGLGNELIARRLMLLYPGRHTLAVTDAGGVYRVELSLKLYAG